MENFYLKTYSYDKWLRECIKKITINHLKDKARRLVPRHDAECL